MSTQAISNISIFHEIQSFYQDRRTDVRQLGSALQSGDLSRAQQAFSALSALGQSGPFSNSEPFANTSRAESFEAIGQALQAGDLAGAQAAFATLQQGHASGSSTSQSPAFLVNISATEGSVDAADSIFQQRQEFRHERKAALQQLGAALDSGNTDAAQQAFDVLTTLGQNGPFKNGQPFQRADRAQDFAAIGQALQSGDLAGATQAYADLASTFGNHQRLLGPPTPLPLPVTLPPVSAGPPQTPPGPPIVLPPATVPPQAQPPVFSSGGPSGPPEIIINVGGSTAPSGSGSELVVNLQNASSTPQEVQIHFGDSHGSIGHLTLDVSQTSDGAEQVSLNVSPGSTNYQFVLNLFDSTSGNATSGNSLSLRA